MIPSHLTVMTNNHDCISPPLMIVNHENVIEIMEVLILMIANIPMEPLEVVNTFHVFKHMLDIQLLREFEEVHIF